MRTIVLVATMMLMGCSKPDVASQVYKFENGRTAFIVDRYQYGFGVRGQDVGGNASLDVLKVNQCKGGQLWWDRGRAVLFRYDTAEISYLADIGEQTNSLSIAACRNNNALCPVSKPSPSAVRIPITCG